MKEFLEEKGDLIKVVAVGILYVASIITFHFIEAEWFIKLIVYLVLWFAVGYEIIFGALKKLVYKPFNEDFLMLLASVGAFVLGDYPEAVAVMLLYSVGELFEDYAEKRSERAIEGLFEMIPKFATVIACGEQKIVETNSINVGDILLVKVGESVAVDGVIISGDAFVDTSMMTGESKPVRVREGDEVLSGYIVSGAPITIRATKVAEESSAAKIIELIKGAEQKKAKSEKFITSFAKVYTPIVIVLALIVAFVPPIFGEELSVWAYRAINLLVIACPCALVVSVPIAFFAGVGRAFSSGIIVKGSAVLERVNSVNVYAFDKTGTLTTGEFSVVGVYPKENAEEILKIAASLEAYSSHPIASAVADSFKGEKYAVNDVCEIEGRGIKGEINGVTALVGSAKLLKAFGAKVPEYVDYQGTLVFVSLGEISGTIAIGDSVKDNSAKIISELKGKGKKTLMLTGDNEESAKAVANEIGIDEYYASLLPEDKLRAVENLKKDGKVCFVGDGINDSPVLSSADLAVAMGSGSDIAAECSDVVIAGDDPIKLSTLNKIAKKTMAVVYTNVIGSITVKAAIFALSVLGLAPMWLAVFADVGVMILATINSMRLSARTDKKAKSAT
ncbi:MAG: cadmium-translocating P-type ATPase [Clostridia bacterium]|nr:cadmium-translocating P-type ATPase [Clostridia bacterium]